jgi:hypothetical protein
MCKRATRSAREQLCLLRVKDGPNRSIRPVPCIRVILPRHTWNGLHEDPVVNALPKRLDLARVTDGQQSLMAFHLGFLHQRAAWRLRTRPSFPRRYSQRLPSSSDGLPIFANHGIWSISIRKLSILVMIGGWVEMATHQRHFARVELYRYRGPRTDTTTLEKMLDDFHWFGSRGGMPVGSRARQKPLNYRTQSLQQPSTSLSCQLRTLALRQLCLLDLVSLRRGQAVLAGW